eukprot:g3856.t1
MATIEALRKAEQAFRALDECTETREKLNLLLKIEKFVLVDDPSYRCIESVLQNFLQLRHYDSRPPPLRRYLAYFLEQVALRKSKMALRCVPACISLLEDPDSVTRQIVIQSARSLQSRALLLIGSGCFAKASTAQSSNVEAACQALGQLQDRIWMILEYSVENMADSATRIQNTPFHQACLFAHSRLQGLITLLDSCLTLPDNCADHIISLLEALSIVGRYRPQLLPKILDVFERLVGQDPWLDTLLSFHTRVFLATPLDGDYHAKCVHVLKRIDPTSAALPMENIIAVARQDQLRARQEDKQRYALVRETLDLPFDGDTLLGTEQVVSAAELVENDQTKFVEPYTLMTLRLNPKDAARICINGLEKQLDGAKMFEQSLRATRDLASAAAAAGGGGQGGTTDRKAAGGIAATTGINRVTQFEGTKASQEIQELQQMVFQEVLQAKSRMQTSLQAACVAESSLKRFDGVNNRVISHLASFVEDPLLEEVFYGKAIGKALIAKTGLSQAGATASSSTTAAQAADAAAASSDTWQQDILPLFFAKYASTIQRLKPTTTLKMALETQSDAEFSYARLFELFLRVYTKQFGGVAKKELREFFGLLPYLPDSLFGKLENQCHHEGTRRQALITCFYVAEKFPQCRAQAMRLLFKMAYTHAGDQPITDESTCQTATRFLAGKVYTPVVVGGAAGAASSTGRMGRAGGAGGSSAISMEALKAKDLEDMSALMLRSMVGYQRFEHQLKPAAYVQQIYEEILNHANVVSEAQRHWLFLAMTIKKPQLFSMLLEVFAIAETNTSLEHVKSTLLEHISEAIKHIEPRSEQGSELLQVIEGVNRAASLDLVAKMLIILLNEKLDAYENAKTDDEKKALQPNLPTEFRDIVLKRYEALGNQKLLIPIISLVPRTDCLKYLAEILNSQAVQTEEVKFVIRHLVRTSNHSALTGEDAIGIPELISEIHHFNTTEGDIVQTSRSIAALNALFELLDTEIDSSRYVFALQSLAEEEADAVGLPTLIFRTLIQLQRHSDFFNDFITGEILPHIVKKNVLFHDEHKRLFEGLKYSLKISFEKTADKRVAAKVLSLLPLRELEDLIAQFPEWKDHLKDYCSTQALHLIPHHVRQMLQ